VGEIAMGNLLTLTFFILLLATLVAGLLFRLPPSLMNSLWQIRVLNSL
jgi:hypothetical protein